MLALGTSLLLLLAFSSSSSIALPYILDQAPQTPFNVPSLKQSSEEPWANALKHSGLSKWSKQTKDQFIQDLKDNKADHWTITMGNEAGDLDSLVSAVAYAWHLSHLSPNPIPAVALLQTEEDAIDLRPENTYALKKSGMKHAHADLLALDDLGMHRSEVAQRVKALALVDHNTLLSTWKADDKVVSVIDHHADRGAYPDAHPRVIETSGSCSTLVAREMLQHQHEAGDLPPELVDLLLSAIALDTDDPEPDTIDYNIAKELFPYSSWRDKNFEKAIHKLDKRLTKAKKDLDHLDVRDLLRRDWKGDMVHSRDSNATHKGQGINVGYASIPGVSLHEMVDRTESQTIEEYFEIESAFTHDIKADISVALTKFKDDNKDKHREIILVVKAIYRLNEEQARSLYNKIVEEVENNPELRVSEWKGDLGESGHKRKVWWNNNLDAGRKVVRPVIETAVMDWLDEHDL